MSEPNIPDINPIINIDRDQVINLVLASIGLEELALGHALNAGAEGLQFIISATPAPVVDNLFDAQQSLIRILRNSIKKEILLQFKLEDILQVPEITTTTTTSVPLACECSLEGSGIGNISGEPPVDQRFVGGFGNIQDPTVCVDCLSSGFHLAYLAQNQGTTLRLTAIQDEFLTIQCPDPFNPDPTPENPNVMTITGNAIVEFKDPPSTDIIGTATFTYIFKDGGQPPNADVFSIDIVSATPELNHFSGDLTLNGNFTIGECVI